jgi:hypothetical protein
VNTPSRVLVSAPSLELYENWLVITGRDPAAYRYIASYEQLSGYWGRVIVLNGGSQDVHIRSLLVHPARYALLDRLEV